MATVELSSSSSSESESDGESNPLVPFSKRTYGFLTLECSKQKELEDAPSTSKDSQKSIKLSSSLQPGINFSGTYLNIFPHRQAGDTAVKLKQLSSVSRLNELENKNVVSQPGFEKRYTVPRYVEGRKKIRRERLKERDKTKGASWFNMPATEITDEIKNDLAILQMRNSLDPKHFYKRGNEKICPKYFRVGTVVESPIDFYHARIPKKQRKRTLVEELLADAEFNKYQKRKYAEVLKNQPQKFHRSSQKKKKMQQKGPKKHNKKTA